MAVSLGKKNILIIGIIAVFAAIFVRLFQIQIIDKKYRVNAENNALKYETIYPARGQILDRNGKPIVQNKIAYDLMVTPIEVVEFDTLAFCQIFGLEKEFVVNKFNEYKRYRKKIGYSSMTFLKHVPAKQYNIFSEQNYRFQGFSAVSRTTRTYPYNAGGNLIGYISEVDEAYLKKNPTYKSGDYAGKTGIEQAYESRLCGEKGYTIYLRDAHNRIKERYDDGDHDKEAVPGNDISTTIDVDLQAYGELLMQNKVGSVVAIEPSTGEVLAMISSPGIDVKYLANISQYYNEIISNPLKPMFNRAVMSPQPPGSVFKLVNGLIGLQEKVITPESRFPCHRGFAFGGVKLGCHNHPSPLDFRQSIMMSCNAYYCYVLRAILDNPKYPSIEDSFNKWRDYVMSFGFGQKLGSDIPYELGGNVPKTTVYDKIHGKGRWRSLSIISLSIGQGELGCTPLHLANLAATIANHGYYYIPHIIKDDTEYPIDPKYLEKKYTMVDTSYFSIVAEGMYMAVQGGPGATARIAAIDGIDLCGKTGTAQNPHGDDHSVFICFGPADNPKIAVAAYIENAGFGATWAAPIASLMIEKYLKGEVGENRKWLEQRIVESNLLYKVNQKVKNKKK